MATADAKLTGRFTARSCTEKKVPDRQTAQPDKPSRRNPDKHVVSRIHPAPKDPAGHLPRSAVGVSPVNYWETGAQMPSNGGWLRRFDELIPLPRPS
jgi:hypothetical protein